MVYRRLRECWATQLRKATPHLYSEVEGHQDKFEVDIEYERKLQMLPRIWPKAWIDRGYWSFCDAHRKALFGGYDTRTYIRICLWGGKEGTQLLSPADIRAVGLNPRDFPPFE